MSIFTLDYIQYKVYMAPCSLPIKLYEEIINFNM